MRSATDLTERMQRWARRGSAELEREGLRGFTFTSRSPCFGPRGIKVNDAKGNPAGRGQGMFARAFTERFPHLPVEDEGRLGRM